MNVLALTYMLSLITSQGVTEVGSANDDLRCAAAIGYLTKSLELEGGQPAGEFMVTEEGAYFSINYAMPGGEVVTLACEREDV